jgi:hypothetical protein
VQAPALTWAKVPAGAVACPELLVPQHASAPSVLTPQVCSPPALTWMKAPLGGTACPWPLAPQQAALPSVRTAQE